MNDETVQERIKRVRKAMDMTQAAFGKRIGLKRNSVALIEGGRATSDQTIFSICREFGVNEDWLRTGGGGDAAMFAPASRDDITALVKKYRLPPETYNLIREFVRLPDRSQLAVIDYVRRVAQSFAEGGGLVLPNPHDMTPDEMAEEARRQAEAEIEDREKGGGPSSISGRGSSGTECG